MSTRALDVNPRGLESARNQGRGCAVLAQGIPPAPDEVLALGRDLADLHRELGRVQARAILPAPTPSFGAFPLPL